MNSTYLKKTMSFPHTERGVVLIVGLIMMLLMTIVALSSIRGSGLQEAMAGNMRDRNVALQACESALRDGESLVGPDVSDAALPAFSGANGAYLDLNSTPANSVNFFSERDWVAKAQVSSLVLASVNSAPRYIVEKISVDRVAAAAAVGNGIGLGSLDTTGVPEPFRISCNGVGVSPDAQVTAQSIFARLSFD